MNDYKHTLNLLKTKFDMRANLTQREPTMLKFWEENQAALAMTSASGSQGRWVLHDGPPYANGHIHMGTAMNKVLKDIIIKSRNMQGFACVYIPGWDCHGLPIEHKVEQDIKGKNKHLDPLSFRKLCREYAQDWISIQKKEFMRLGVLGDWQNPYLSMQPEYEAAIASNLAKFVEEKAVIRSKKSIHWCASCHTALAEAEVEYSEELSPSLYVAFGLEENKLKKVFPSSRSDASIIIWTTTPWTIPDNVAIAVHPDFSYGLVEAEGKQYIIAEALIENVAKELGWNKYKLIQSVPGTALEGLSAKHPYLEKFPPIVLGTHVTLDAGTGCVHTAPGHGREDFEVGQKYDLEILSPIDDHGRFLTNVEIVGGKTIWEANPIVIEKLKDSKTLLKSSEIRHSYPHCWRCKDPVIFRATTQWFIDLDANELRKRALSAINTEISWIPPWGRDRIYNMIESRPDWCISRQRIWGVPILALLCENCGEAWNDPTWMREICARFATHERGCDFWYETPLEEILPPGLKCPHCGQSKWKKETDILDVWFDSGSSFAPVLEGRPGLHFPADLYLEGSDQHRGWFHSSLLIAEGVRKSPPYRTVLTHGYVVDGEGRKMSKSIGNVIAPQTLIDKYGAEILRIWAASVDYREDIRISDEILLRLVDAYRRIRNTCRFILGNLYDFTGDDQIPLSGLLPLDRYALHIAAVQYEDAKLAYREFEFHKVFHNLHNYCVTDLSALYFDVLKDRLYSSVPNSRERRSAQTALWEILNLLLRIMAPILSFTAEEIFQILPSSLKGPQATVFALQDVDTQKYALNPDSLDDWSFLISLRGFFNRLLEPMRQNKIAGLSLDTALTLYLTEENRARIENITDLREFFNVSQITLAEIEKAPEATAQDPTIPGAAISIEKAKGTKCARCWSFTTEIGKDPRWPDICPRCASVLDSLESR